MSTRATYSFENSSDEWAAKTTIYIHYDGYPQGAAWYFWNVLQLENQRGDMATRFIRANENAEITLSHDSHGDTEYRYSLDGNTLTAEKRTLDFDWDNPTFECFFVGDWREFVNQYGERDGFTLIENFEPIREVAWGRFHKRWATKTQLVAHVRELQEKHDAYKAKFPGMSGNLECYANDLAAASGALGEF